jgi:hypothetical protein
MTFEESFLLVHPLPWSVGYKSSKEYVCDANDVIVTEVWAVGAGDLIVAKMNGSISHDVEHARAILACDHHFAFAGRSGGEWVDRCTKCGELG